MVLCTARVPSFVCAQASELWSWQESELVAPKPRPVLHLRRCAALNTIRGAALVGRTLTNCYLATSAESSHTCATRVEPGAIVHLCDGSRDGRGGRGHPCRLSVPEGSFEAGRMQVTSHPWCGFAHLRNPSFGVDVAGACC